MKESVLRAAAIASLALALIVSVTTWVGLSSSSQRGSFYIGFFEFALILFLGVVAWALFNSLADIVTVRGSLDILSARMTKIEEALGVRLPPEAPEATAATATTATTATDDAATDDAATDDAATDPASPAATGDDADGRAPGPRKE